MVKIRKDTKAIPFPRRITRWELERFWKKLQEDVWECGEIMPNKSEFDRKFAFLTYDSFNEARKNYRMRARSFLPVFCSIPCGTSLTEQGLVLES